MEQSINTQSMALLEGSSILRNLAIGDHWRCLNGLVDPQSFYFPALLHCCHGMSTLFHCEFLCLILVLRQGQPRWTETPQKGTKITLSSLSIVYCRYFQRQKTNTDSRALQLLWQMRKFRVCRNECIFSAANWTKAHASPLLPSVPFLQSLWCGLLVPLK